MIQHLHKMSSQLRADADELLEYFDRLESTTSVLQLDEKTAVQILRDAANAVREYADEEQYLDISGDYISASQWFDNLADSITQDSTWHDKEDLSELKSSIKYIRSTALFLQRFEAVVASAQLVTGDARVELLERLQKYLQGYEEFRQLLREVRDTTRGNSLGEQLQAAVLRTRRGQSEIGLGRTLTVSSVREN